MPFLNSRFIVLVGSKHSGKTSAGKALASLLSCRFADLDDYITQRSGKSPRVLYIEGSKIFREAEAEALTALFEAATANHFSLMIIASGGGLIDNPDALAILKKNTEAISIFLDVSAETAWTRISRAGELPPFLKTETPKETHRLLHERRAAAYRQLASLVLNAEGKSPGEVAEEIKNKSCLLNSLKKDSNALLSIPL